MTQKENGPEGPLFSREANSGTLSKANQKTQGQRPTSFAGAKVSIDRRQDGFFVRLLDRPWGFRALDKVCLTEAAADRYADQLRDKLTILRLRDELQQSRKREARLLERLKTMGARNA